MNTTMRCLDVETLQHVKSGRLTLDFLDSALDHLGECEACKARFDATPVNEDSFVDSLRKSMPDDRWSSESACQAAIVHLVESNARDRGKLALESRSLGDFNPSTANVPDEIGVYKLGSVLGSGGMGIVYLAQHVRLKKLCAIKLLPRHHQKQPELVERFERETSTAGQLEHPNIVRALDAGDIDGWHYLVMEYLDGYDLAKIANFNGKLSTAAIVEIAYQAAIALKYVHENGLVHRDIKPSNFMITRHGQLKLLDLGLALLQETMLTDQQQLTSIGRLMGTLDYMAPEQLDDCHSVDYRADLYGLGATLYRLHYGISPLESIAPQGGIRAKLSALASGKSPPFNEAENLPEAKLNAIVQRLLQPQANNRFDSCHTLIGMLEPLRNTASNPLEELIREVDRRAAETPNHSREENPKLSIHPNLNLLTQRENPKSDSSENAPRQVGSVIGRDGYAKRIGWISSVFAAFCLAGLLIYIATDRGEIVIQSDDPGLQIRVMQGETEVRAMELQTKSESIAVRSGRYQIDLRFVGDRYEISDESVQVFRGEKQLVSIARKPMQNDSSANEVKRSPIESYAKRSAIEGAIASGGEPTFEGYRFADWLTVMKTETSSKNLATGIVALKTLATNESQEREAVAAILKASRQFGSKVIDGSDATKFAESLWGDSALSFLQFSRAVLAESILDELRSGNARSKATVVSILWNSKFQNWTRFPVDQFDAQQESPEFLSTELVRNIAQSLWEASTSISEAKHSDIVADGLRFGSQATVKNTVLQAMNQSLAMHWNCNTPPDKLSKDQTDFIRKVYRDYREILEFDDTLSEEKQPAVANDGWAWSMHSEVWMLRLEPTEKNLADSFLTYLEYSRILNLASYNEETLQCSKILKVLRALPIKNDSISDQLIEQYLSDFRPKSALSDPERNSRLSKQASQLLPKGVATSGFFPGVHFPSLANCMPVSFIFFILEDLKQHKAISDDQHSKLVELFKRSENSAPTVLNNNFSPTIIKESQELHEEVQAILNR